MGIWSSFVDIVDFLWRHRDNDNEHSRKRRADEICDMPDNKLRCVESLLHNGEAHSVIHDSGSRKKDRSNVFPSPQLREKVYISSWNHNGKENCHDFRSVMKNHNMDDKHSEDDIQILEEHNFRSSKKGQRSSNTPFKASCSNGLNNVAQCRSPQSSKDAEIVQILQSPRMNRNEAKVLTNRTPASRDERGNRSSHLTNKPFKATDLPSSTPVTFSSRRSIVHSPEEPEIEVLPSPSMASGVSPFPYRNQNSSVLADSINTQRSSNCSTLYHLKRVEEEEAYSRLFVQCCGVERPMKMSSPKSPEVVELDAPRRNSILKPSFRSPIKYHSSPMAEARGKRISVPVEIAKSEPSTSASRQQIEDQDLQFIGQVQRPEPVKFTTPDVLDEILKKYADKEKKMEEIRAEEKKCRLLSERNRHAEVQRRVNVEKEILEQIESFLHIVEEIPQDEAPSLPVLTEEMEAEIDKALGAHPDAVLANAFNLSIKGRDMRTLKPLAWLNDEVINFYMNLLIERGKSESYPSVHAFNTFFFPKLIGSGYDSLKRWTRKVDIFSHDFILVPIHRGMHWCMAIINMKEKVICYYDSMDGRFPQCADALLNYLQKESMDKKKQPFDTSGWIKEHAENIPQQNNGSDCGMFACMYAEYVSRNAPISFTQDDMPYFRRKVVYEILKIKLLT